MYCICIFRWVEIVKDALSLEIAYNYLQYLMKDTYEMVLHLYWCQYGQLLCQDGRSSHLEINELVEEALVVASTMHLAGSPIFNSHPATKSPSFYLVKIFHLCDVN